MFDKPFREIYQTDYHIFSAINFEILLKIIMLFSSSLQQGQYAYHLLFLQYALGYQLN
jgi:hypothetical protein